jgi:hypothetical protein
MHRQMPGLLIAFGLRFVPHLPFAEVPESQFKACDAC